MSFAYIGTIAISLIICPNESHFCVYGNRTMQKLSRKTAMHKSSTSKLQLLKSANVDGNLSATANPKISSDSLWNLYGYFTHCWKSEASHFRNYIDVTHPLATPYNACPNLHSCDIGCSTNQWLPFFVDYLSPFTFFQIYVNTFHGISWMFFRTFFSESLFHTIFHHPLRPTFRLQLCTRGIGCGNFYDDWWI